MMKKKNKKRRVYEQVLIAHNISLPVKNRKALLRLFSARTNSTIQINKVLDTTKLLIAIRQSALKKKKCPSSS